MYYSTRPLCSFYHQNILTNLPLWVFWSLYLCQNHQTRFKMVHSSPIKSKSRVHESQACYLHTTYLGGLKFLVSCPGIQWPQRGSNSQHWWSSVSSVYLLCFWRMTRIILSFMVVIHHFILFYVICPRFVFVSVVWLIIITKQTQY